MPGTEHELPADLVLIAIGFSHPEHEGLVEQLGVDLDYRLSRSTVDRLRPEPAFLITKPYQPETVKAIISQALFFDRRAQLCTKLSA